MDITLEQSLETVVKYMQNNAEEGTGLYFDEIPENFCVPSIYFPVPQSFGEMATLSSWRATTKMDIWFLDSLDWDAQRRAAEIRDGIMLDRCLLPVTTDDGEKTGKFLRVTPPETRKIDEGIVQVSLSFTVYFYPEEQTTKAWNFYYSWKKIREQEVQKWRQKRMLRP